MRPSGAHVLRNPQGYCAVSDHIVYVDESGDHSLTSIDSDYPVFVLTFCVFDMVTYAEEVVPRVTRFKFQHFGHDQIVLHEREIRKATGAFSFLRDAGRRRPFYEDRNDLMRDADFKLIAAVIDKNALARQYSQPESPYDLALTFCLERLYRHLPGTRMCVVVEKRGAKEDKELELVFRRICDGANTMRQELPFRIIFADKLANSSGLQFADLTARPIGLRVLRPNQPNRAWNILEAKFRRNSLTGSIDGWGLKIFP